MKLYKVTFHGVGIDQVASLLVYAENEVKAMFVEEVECELEDSEAGFVTVSEVPIVGGLVAVEFGNNV